MSDFGLIGFILLFAVVCAVAISLMSVLGGWHRLAGHFRDFGPPQGKRFLFASMSMGPKGFQTNYGGCLTVFLGRKGIRLSVWLPFRFMHPPLLIPWTEIESVHQEKIFFRIHYVIQIRKTRTRMVFFGKLGQSIEKAWETMVGPHQSS
jgi:hypothetical protein